MGVKGKVKRGKRGKRGDRAWREKRRAKSTHHPHKSDDQHRKCKTGGGAHFAFFLGSSNSHTTPPEIPPDEEALSGKRNSYTSTGSPRVFFYGAKSPDEWSCLFFQEHPMDQGAEKFKKMPSSQYQYEDLISQPFVGMVRGSWSLTWELLTCWSVFPELSPCRSLRAGVSKICQLSETCLIH